MTISFGKKDVYPIVIVHFLGETTANYVGCAGTLIMDGWPSSIAKP